MLMGDQRRHLDTLDWGTTGLTRDDIRAQWADMPEPMYNQLPPDFTFPDTGSLASYLQHVASHNIVQGEPPAGEPPRAWGPSPTGRVMVDRERSHGVGSGAGSGETGSGAQTGESRDGVSYGGEKSRQG